MLASSAEITRHAALCLVWSDAQRRRQSKASWKNCRLRTAAIRGCNESSRGRLRAEAEAAPALEGVAAVAEAGAGRASEAAEVAALIFTAEDGGGTLAAGSVA